MPCAEAIRLRADYDAALMLWGRTLFSAQRELNTTDHSRLAALNARNEAATVWARFGGLREAYRLTGYRQ
jgi:hypothetical protein